MPVKELLFRTGIYPSFTDMQMQTQKKSLTIGGIK